MKSRTRTRATEEESSLHYDAEISRYDEVTDEDIELFLSEAEEEKTEGFWNLPTVAGLSLILFGTGYLFQELGFWTGFNLAALAEMLPWLAGILIILIGFGVLGWKPKSRKRKRREREEARRAAERPATGTTAARTATRTTGEPARRRLTKSHNKKLFGVAGGIADYFHLDPTIIRIAFVVSMLFTAPAPIVLYLVLAFVLPPPEPRKVIAKTSADSDETVYIIRDR